MICVVDLIKANKSFKKKKLEEVIVRKSYVVRQMFGDLKICLYYFFRRLRLPQSKTPWIPYVKTFKAHCLWR